MRTFAVLVAATALVALAGCVSRHAPVSPVSAPPAAALRVGTSGDYAPFSVLAADGTLGGFDVEIARSYAADRGRALVLVPFRWPELATRLAAGDFDVVMSGVTVRPDRLVTGIMTATVARAEAVLAVVASAPSGAGGTDFDRPQRTIAVNRGGHLEQVARARFPRARLVPVDDNASLPALLARREADAIVTDTLELAAFNARCVADATSDATPCLRVADRLARDRKAYWLPLSQAALAADLDLWLLARERSGWLPDHRARVLGDAEAVPLDAPLAALIEHVRRRLSLMPAVAAAKRVAGLPIEDRTREAAVARAAAARATAAGLDTPSFVGFVRREIAAAKAIQRAAPANAPAPFTLDELRRAIDRLDARIVAELGGLAPVAASADSIAAALASDDVPALTRDVARGLARALAGVHRQADVFSTGRAAGAGGIVSVGVSG